MTFTRGLVLGVLAYVGLTAVRHYFGQSAAFSTGIFVMGFCIGGLIFDRPRP